VNSKQYRSSRVDDDDDYSYYNNYELMKGSRRRGRQHARGWRSQARGHRRRGWRAATAHSVNTQTAYLLLFTVSVGLLLPISTVDTIG